MSIFAQFFSIANMSRTKGNVTAQSEYVRENMLWLVSNFINNLLSRLQEFRRTQEGLIGKAKSDSNLYNILPNNNLRICLFQKEIFQLDERSMERSKALETNLSDPRQLWANYQEVAL